MLFICLLLFSNCTKDTISGTAPLSNGKIKIQFIHTIEGQPIQLNTNSYVNDAGNHYELTDLMYFISDVTLYPHNGSPLLITDSKSVHYTDIHITSSLNWYISDQIPSGIYDSLSFTFGLNQQRNISNTFVNPPESNMAWPDMLGGGYHYMMINGKWINPQNNATPFNFHLGIGQLYGDTINYDVNTITAFFQNWFKVSLPLASLKISKDITSVLQLKMAVDSWFKTPHSWDHDYWGGSVMQKQRAMQCIKENGFDVFSITSK